MNIIYFPFSDIGPQRLKKLIGLLGPLVLYRPDPADKNQPGAGDLPSEWAELSTCGMLKVRRPDFEGAQKLPDALKAYRQWAEMYGLDAGLKNALMAAGGREVPFFSDTAVSKIRSDIKATTDKRSPSPQPASQPLFEACLFLWVAQEFDAMNRELARDLSEVDRKQQVLFKALKGETVESGLEAESDPQDPGLFNPDQRIKAWLRLYWDDRSKTKAEEPDLLVTDSAAVFEQLQELLPEMKILGEELPPGQEDPNEDSRGSKTNSFRQTLENRIHTLSETDDPTDVAQEYLRSPLPLTIGILTLASLPGQSVAELLGDANAIDTASSSAGNGLPAGNRIIAAFYHG